MILISFNHVRMRFFHKAFDEVDGIQVWIQAFRFHTVSVTVCQMKICIRILIRILTKPYDYEEQAGPWNF